MRSRAGWFVGMLFILAASAPARADVPPPQACTAPGQPCNNAGPSSNQAGACATTTCSRSMPLPDGGTMVTTYSCMLCVAPADGGGGGATGSGGAGGGAADGSTTTPPRSSGCSVGGHGGTASPAGTFALAGLLLVTLGRRRRRVR